MRYGELYKFVNVCRLHIELYVLWDVAGVTRMTDWKE